jgi:1-acyl-sn-glycerol-3-phosphate acyltransferase
MKIALLGKECELSRATAIEVTRRGHVLTKVTPHCAILFPSGLKSLKEDVAESRAARLVLRSHAAVYGAGAKNPGYMTEERLSLWPDGAPEQQWLQAERICVGHKGSKGWAVVRLATVLENGQESSDQIVQALCKGRGVTVAGRDPQSQFVSVNDAARALADAAESQATGIFNVAGGGAVPLKKVYRAAGVRRLPLPKWVAKKLNKQESAERLEYNWTVSSARAESELGWRPEMSSAEALREFIRAQGRGLPELLQQDFDPWGLDLNYINAWEGWFKFLKRTYWRIDFEGLNNIPAAGRGVFVSNHRGFMPLDAVMHLSLAMQERRRVIRFLIIPCLLYFPFLSNFMTKLGGVIASQDNAARLMERENLVGIFPEGIRGTFLPYRDTYKLRDFGKSAFAAIAVEHQAPIIPAAVIGHAEIFPILGRFDWAWAKKVTGWPYFPIAPPFPLLPMVPLPSKWHVRVLPPVSVNEFKPEDARNEKLMVGFARYVQSIVQQNIDEMRMRRKHIFWGRVLDGTAPARPAFTKTMAVKSA